ncbi:MAG: serine hydrolase [Chloroflexota bacterium]
MDRPADGSDDALVRARLHRRIQAVEAGLNGRLAVVVQGVADDAPAVTLHEDAVYSSASIIKLPILWSFFEQVDASQLDPAERWQLADDSRVDGSGVLKLLQHGADLTLLDLAALMIAVSDNSATNVLIDRLGLAAIQQSIARLGLTGTGLGRKMYDFEARARGLENVATARDIARLLLRFYRGDGLSAASAAEARRILGGQQLNAGLPARLPYDTVWHKTGNLPGLLHDAGWIERDGRAAVVVAFTDQLANDGDGAQALAAIGEAVWSWLA